MVYTEMIRNCILPLLAMARRTKAEVAATREALLDSAESLFLEQGVSNTSLEQIARSAGMTRGAIYWHFRNKADLFDAMLTRVRLPMDQLIADLEDREQARAPLEGVRQAFYLALSRLALPRYHRVYTILFHRCESNRDFSVIEIQNRLARESFAHLLKRCAQAQQEGLLSCRLDAHCAARLLQTTMLGLIYDWLREPAQYDIEQEGSKIIETLFMILHGDKNDG
jgi:TetR/AcrR family acrAB operon transcriptional repressor